MDRLRKILDRFLLAAIIFIPVLVFSQNRDTVFNVKAVSSGIKLVPETDILYKDISKKFKIIKSATTKIDTIIFEGGTVRIKDSIIVLKATKSKTVLLKIYEKQTGGKSVLALVKEFQVIKKIDPLPNLDGVGNDSAIHRIRAVDMGYLYLPSNPDPLFKTKSSYKVVSFNVQIVNNGNMDTLTTTGNRMSFKMRDAIDKMQDGNVLQFNNIRYQIESDTLIAPPFRVYLINDSITKF